MTMRAKLIVALVGGVLAVGMAATVASAGRGGPPNPSDPASPAGDEDLFEWYEVDPDPHIPEPHVFRVLDTDGTVDTLYKPEPLIPTTSDHCRWTGFNGGEVDGDLDSAYWLYYREFWNQQSADTDLEGLGDRLYGKQGDCMKNKGVNPDPDGILKPYPPE